MRKRDRLRSRNSPGAAAWDGLVSSLRVYSEAELREMVAPFAGGLEWIHGTYPYRPFGRGYYFFGVRSERSADPGWR